MRLTKKRSVSERRDLILNGGIVSTMFILSVPTLMMSVVQSLVPLSDGFFLNNYGGYLVASSVTFSQPIINGLNGLSMGLGVATTAILGQLNGRGEIGKVKETSQQIIVFSFILGLVIAPLSVLAAYIITGFVGNEIKPYVFTYLSLYSFIIPMIFLAAIYNGIKNAMGQPEATLIRMSLLLMLKIIFNVIFLYKMKLGIHGAVLASLCSYIIISAWMFFDLFIKKSEVKLTLRGFRFIKSTIKDLIRIGLPSMANYVMISLGFFLINMDIEGYGAKVLAAQGIAVNINTICFILPSAISVTVTTMISMNIGAKNVKKAKKIFKVGCVAGFAMATLLAVSFYTFGPQMIAQFQRHNPDPVIISTALRAHNLYTFSVFAFALYLVAQSVFVGLGKTRITLVMGITRIWLFRYIFIILTKKYLGVDSVFYGNLVSNYVAAAIFLLMVKKVKWVSAIHTVEE